MDTLTKAIPEHLLSLSWFDLEEERALSVLSDLESELKGIHKKLSPKRVHQARVVIRRWYSIWEILSADNWQDNEYEKSVGLRLGKFNKNLGKLRDIDVNIAMAKQFQAPIEFVLMLEKRRSKIEAKLYKKITKVKVKKILRGIEEHLSRRAYELEKMLDPLPEDDIDGPILLDGAAYPHIDAFLKEQEEETKELSRRARTEQELHKLRLTIKRWRYLLTEFFGVTNLILVEAQSDLGKHHDLTRLRTELTAFENKSRESRKKSINECHERIKLELKRLEEDFLALVDKLPYGLRPYKVSTLIG